MAVNGYIDLRSDTVTLPTQAMREAMYTAEVGDDVYRDDVTVNRLEERAAEILGKEAALFVSSGTMGNLLGVLTQTRRGDEIILGADGHIFTHEVAGAAAIGGVSMRQLPYPGSMPDAEMIRKAIRPADIHEPPTTLLCLENALGCGKAVPLSVMNDAWHAAKEKGMAVHLDGARLFNAALALNTDVKAITRWCDTVNCCLAKGLCAPVGSIFAGPAKVVESARRFRKMLGGGTRQCGFLAAAGLIAIEEMPKRLTEDHANAHYLAEKLSAIQGVQICEDQLDINMVFFTLSQPESVQENIPELLLKQGIRVHPGEQGMWRLVTHKDVTREELDRVIDGFHHILTD